MEKEKGVDLGPASTPLFPLSQLESVIAERGVSSCILGTAVLTGEEVMSLAARCQAAGADLEMPSHQNFWSHSVPEGLPVVALCAASPGAALGLVTDYVCGVLQGASAAPSSAPGGAERSSEAAQREDYEAQAKEKKHEARKQQRRAERRRRRKQQTEAYRQQHQGDQQEQQGEPSKPRDEQRQQAEQQKHGADSRKVVVLCPGIVPDVSGATKDRGFVRVESARDVQDAGAEEQATICALLRRNAVVLRGTHVEAMVAAALEAKPDVLLWASAPSECDAPWVRPDVWVTVVDATRGAASLTSFHPGDVNVSCADCIVVAKANASPVGVWDLRRAAAAANLHAAIYSLDCVVSVDRPEVVTGARALVLEEPGSSGLSHLAATKYRASEVVHTSTEGPTAEDYDCVITGYAQQAAEQPAEQTAHQQPLGAGVPGAGKALQKQKPVVVVSPSVRETDRTCPLAHFFDSALAV